MNIETQILDLNNQAEAILSCASAEGRELTVSENAQLDWLIAESKPLIRQYDAERGASHLAAAASLGRLSEPDSIATRTVEPTRYADAQSTMPHGTVGRKTFASVFGRDTGGADTFRSFGQFVRCIANGMHHTGLREVSADFNEGSGTSGGYFVPPQFASGLLNHVLETSIVMQRCRVIGLSSNILNAPGFDRLNHGLIGGFAPVWLAEGATAVDQTGIIKSISLRVKKLAVFSAATNEMLADGGGAFAAELERNIGDAIAHGLDYCFLNTGSGVGQPLSVLNSPSLIEVAKTAGQVADTLTFANVVAMYERLLPACVPTAEWFAHPSVLPQLFSLSLLFKNAAGNENVGGALAPVFFQVGRNRFSLMGIPLSLTEKLPVLGNRGDLLLADLTQYLVGMRREISMERSIHAGWQNDTTKFRAITRVDGQSTWERPATPLNGETLGWAVVMAERG